MRRRNVLAALVGAAALVLVPVTAQGANGHANYRAVCPGPAAGHAHCHVLVVTDSHGNPKANTLPAGYSPATIKSAYAFSTSKTVGAGATIAIVDAYDDPNAESDLNVFSSQFGLPSCTTANGCFTKVNQTGGASYPRSNSGWALEISLDIQWAHAIAPGAKILLVEASSNSFSNLLAAEDYAKTHAQYVSNSWGGSESSSEQSYDSHFSQSGVSFFVSAGDSGLPAEYPSASPNVISVGGTTLTQNGGSWSETGWSSGGGGCSAYESAKSAQSSFSQYGQVGCNGKRATPDVALDANPSSGVAVYDSTSYYGQAGWFVVGGTSASSPMWAARSADAGVVVNSTYVYRDNIAFRDITSGNNGAPCLSGFDLCTGRGSWTGSGGSSGGSTLAPDFGISTAPSSQAVTAGESASYGITVTPNASFTGSVDLTLSGNPNGVTGTFNPTPTAGSSTLQISTTAGTQPGTYVLTVTGSGDGVTHSTTVSLTVQATAAADFSLSVSPGNRTVKRGQTAGYSVTVTPSGGFTGSVQLDVAGAPGDTNPAFAPNPATTSSTLTIITTSSDRGSYTLTITGTSTTNPSLTHSVIVTLKVH